MRLTALACLVLAVSASSPAEATYSIVACERASGQCGVAVQTDNLAVGASVPAAQAGVGALASQFETHPRHGPRGLALLAQGLTPAAVLRQLLAEDGGFEGRGPEARQVGLVSITGAAAAHTGADAAAADWAGARSGPGFSVQGNGLAGPQVLDAMANAFVAAAGPLADRLMAALRAGDRAGGQRTGRQSAALLVRTPEGFPLDVDLRVDDAGDPVAALSRLYDLQASRQAIIEARLTARRGDTAGARSLLRAAYGAGACVAARPDPRGGGRDRARRARRGDARPRRRLRRQSAPPCRDARPRYVRRLGAPADVPSLD